MMMKTILFSAGATMLALTGCSKTTDPSPAGTETKPIVVPKTKPIVVPKMKPIVVPNKKPTAVLKKIPKTCNLDFEFDSEIDFWISSSIPNFESIPNLPWNKAGETVKTVSVNAGNQNLRVSGGGINRMWKTYLNTEQKISEHFLAKFYGEMHSQLLKISSKTSPTTYQDFFKKDSNVKSLKLFSSTCKAAAHKNKKETTGAVFLDIFDRTFEPRKRNTNDVGMLYVVGPDARSPFINNIKKKFLDEVKAVAKNAVELVHHHNSKCAKKNKIENLRWYFVSGGIFRGYKGKELATEEEVAEATIEGMIAVDSTEKLQITFAHEKKGVNVFETTMGQKFEKA